MSPATDSEGPYAAAWKDFKRRQRINWILWIGYLPVGGLAIWIGSLVGSDIPAFIIVIPWFCAIPVAWIYLLSFRCPRCSRLFFFRFGAAWQNPIRLRCVHCGLPSGTPNDPGDMSAELARGRALFKKIGLIYGISCVLFLAGLAVLGLVMQKQSAQPKMIAGQFLQQMQAHQYQKAQTFLTPAARTQFQARTLPQWRAFEKAHGAARSYKWIAGGWFFKPEITVHYDLIGERSGGGAAAITLVPHGDEWLIEAVTVYARKEDLFPPRNQVLATGTPTASPGGAQ